MLFLAFAFIVSPAFLIAEVASTRQEEMNFCIEGMQNEREEEIKKRMEHKRREGKAEEN
jgi:guanylate kinase